MFHIVNICPLAAIGGSYGAVMGDSQGTSSVGSGRHARAPQKCISSKRRHRLVVGLLCMSLVPIGFGAVIATSADAVTGATFDDGTRTWTFDTSGSPATASITGCATTSGGGECAGAIVIPSLVTSGVNSYTVTAIAPFVTSASPVFKGNTLITRVTIPGTVFTIGDSSFQDATSLAVVVLNSGLISIGSNAFLHAVFTAIDVPASVVSIASGAFITPPLAAVTLHDGLQSIGDTAFGYTEITSIDIPATVTSIGAWAFYYTPLATATLHAGLQTVGEGAFYDTYLESIIFPATVTTIGSYLFGYDHGSPFQRVDYPMTSITFLGDAPTTLDGIDYARQVPTDLFFDSWASASERPAIVPSTAVFVPPGGAGWPIPPAAYYGIQTAYGSSSGGSGGGSSGGGSSSGGSSGGSGSSTTAPTPIATATPIATSSTSAAPVDPMSALASVVQLPDTETVRPGADVTFVDGKPLQTERRKDAASTKVAISGTDFSVVLGGTSAGGNPLKLSPSGAPILAAQEKLAASGDGYFPGTQIGVYVVEPLTSLGAIGVGADGAFSGSMTMPASLRAGDYVIQMNGYTPASQVRSISVGVTVRSAVLDSCRVGWPAAGTDCGKMAQRPKSGRVSLPAHIGEGRSLLLARKIRMSSGQMADVKVLCRPRTRARDAGDVAYCRTRHKGKRTYVLVRPDMAMTATVSITAPATRKYAAYRYLKTYRIR